LNCFCRIAKSSLSIKSNSFLAAFMESLKALRIFNIILYKMRMRMLFNAFRLNMYLEFQS
ncbi:MAG: hypothetical protein KKA79_10675, partial [Nanoarchaeota archaeon]|nr:hypothetical protein [Nanoarchaeota archaeon]